MVEDVMGGPVPEAPWWLDELEAAAGSPDAPLPEYPGPFEERPGWLEDIEAEMAAEEASSSPQDRFEREFGRPATPEELEVWAPTSLERSHALQDLAVSSFVMRSIADAHWIRDLLTAHDASIADLKARFGAKVGAADGMGGQAFARSVALLTKTDQRHLSHEVQVGLVLRDRLPRTWAAFQQGATTWSRAQKAVTWVDGLAPDLVAAYDEAAAEIVVTSTRVKADLREARERLQDDTSAERARTTFERRTTTVELGSDTGVAFIAEGLATDWIPVNDALQKAAVAAHGVEGETRTVSQLRHDIALDIFTAGLVEPVAAGGVLRVPGRKAIVPTLILTVPALSWLGKTKEPARMAGVGPIPMVLAKALAANATSFIRVLTDPHTGVRLAMDRKTYRPPADLARWVRYRDGRTRFPGKTTPAHLADIDHAHGWADDGRTDDDNLIVLDRVSHNMKTAGLYEDERVDAGIVGFTDAWGRYFEDPPEAPNDPAPPDLIEEALHLTDHPDDCPF